MGEIFRRLLSAVMPNVCRDQPSVGDVVSRIEGDLDSMVADAQGTLARARVRSPEAFDERRNRRAGDQSPSAEGLEVTEFRFDGLQLGNSDIECVRGDSARDEGASS